MARPKRIDLPHCLYHVISRTNSGDIAFRDSPERHAFRKYLAKHMKMFECRIHAYCLMDTHFLSAPGERPPCRLSGGKTCAERKSAAVLLVETLPWTHRDVTEYLGLEGSNTASHHLRTAAESRCQQDALDTIPKLFSR